MSPEEFTKEKHEHLLKTSPDEIADNIIEKINQTEFKPRESSRILDLLKKENINSLISLLQQLEVDLSEKEKKHFKNVPIEVVLKWFRVKEENKEVEEE